MDFGTLFKEMSMLAEGQNRIRRRMCTFCLLRSPESGILSAVRLQKVYADVFWLLLALEVATSVSEARRQNSARILLESQQKGRANRTRAE